MKKYKKHLYFKIGGHLIPVTTYDTRTNEFDSVDDRFVTRLRFTYITHQVSLHFTAKGNSKYCLGIGNDKFTSRMSCGGFIE